MTAQLPIEPLPVKSPVRRYVKWGAGLLIGAVAAWFLWQWANDMSGIRR
ncbi:energy transducer TonB, partial [Pseudomonas sp. HMWF007]